MSQATTVKEDRRYTKDHEWAQVQEGELVIGITAFAVDQLGDVTLVGIDVKPGDTVELGKPFGTIESVKTLSDLFAPISGTVAKVNGELETKPETINDDCWEQGWMIAITPSDPAEVDKLLESGAYEEILKTAAH